MVTMGVEVFSLISSRGGANSNCNKGVDTISSTAWGLHGKNNGNCSRVLTDVEYNGNGSGVANSLAGAI